MKAEFTAFIKKWKNVFAADIAAGCIVYSLLMVNQLVNQLDGMWHGSISYAGAHEVGIGRWLWPLLDKGRGYLSPDPVTSIISVAVFAAAFILVMDAAGIGNRVAAYLGSFLFIVNTGILASLSYRYMSPTFAFSCFFAATAGYLLVRVKVNGVLRNIACAAAGAVFIACMMGLYQAELGCLCLLILVYCLRKLISGDGSLPDLGRKLARALISLIFGALLYFAMVNVQLQVYDTSMSRYGGAENYGVAETISHFFERIPATYRYFAYYYANDRIKTTYFPKEIYVLVYGIILLGFIPVIYRTIKRSIAGGVLAAGCLLLIPAACNSIFFIAFEAEPQIQMIIPVSMCIPLLLGMCLENTADIGWQRYGRAVIPVVMAVVLYGSYIMTIYDQQSMYMGMNSMKELGSEIVTELIRDDLYHPYYSYVFVGRPADSPVYAKNDAVIARANRNAAMGTWNADDEKWATQSWQSFWEHQMGIALRVAGEDALNAALSDPYVQSMPVFPERGSCALVNDVVVVKLAPVE